MIVRKVLCTDNFGVEKYLTTGKIYLVKNEMHYGVVILENDNTNNGSRLFLDWRFKKIYEDYEVELL